MAKFRTHRRWCLRRPSTSSSLLVLAVAALMVGSSNNGLLQFVSAAPQKMAAETRSGEEGNGGGSFEKGSFGLTNGGRIDFENDTGLKVKDEELVKHFDDEEQPAKGKSVIANPFLAMVDSVKGFKKSSRGLRGDPAAVLSEAKAAAKTHLESLRSIQVMYQEGDESGLALAMRTSMGNTGELGEAVTDVKRADNRLDGMLRTDVSSSLDAMPNLSSVSDSQLVELLQPQAIGLIVEETQNFYDTLEEIDLPLLSKLASRRRLDEDLFSSKSDGDGSSFPLPSSNQFQFQKGGLKFSSPSFYGASFSNFRNAIKQMKMKGRARLPKFHRFDRNGDGTGRRLYEEKHQRRLENLEVCTPPCNADDFSCNCKRLATCIDDATHYDIALLFAQGHINTDPESDDFARFNVDNVVDLNLFDADDDVLQKAKDIKDLADLALTDQSEKKCSDLLMELHTSCDLSTEKGTCSEGNSHSYQLTVEQVCDGVDTNIKLLFEQISEEMDGYASNDGGETDVTTCGSKRLAFSACGDFLDEFELLYQGRNEIEYPSPNPMRKDPKIPVDENYNIHFPISYKGKRTVHGVDFLDVLPSPYSDNLRVVTDVKKCMYSPTDSTEVNMANCQDGNDNQAFTYDGSTGQIKHQGECLDYNPDTFDVYLGSCHDGLNQKWRFDTYTNEMKTFFDKKCLDWTGVNGNNLYMNGCLSQANQKFLIPSSWDPAISSSTSNKVRVLSNVNKCMDNAASITANAYMSTCESGNDNQVFTYDPSKRQIKKGGKCLDFDPGTSDVYMGGCHDGLNQKWRFDSHTKELKTFHGAKCLDWDGLDWDGEGTDGLYMNGCHGGNNQKFIIPLSWEPAIGSSDFDKAQMLLATGGEFATRCMESGDEIKDDDGNWRGYQVSMVKCKDGEEDQTFHFDISSREIKHGGNCLDYDPGDNNVYVSKCHDGNNQKWYYEENAIKNLATDRCVDMSKILSDGNYNLYMFECHGEDNQRFLIPSFWHGMRMDDVRVFSDRSKCMDAHPDYNNNIYMTGCQPGNTNQDFTYNPMTQEIHHSGLCLDYNIANSNVYMADCDDGLNQKWHYDSESRLKTFYDDNKCLDWSDSGNNIYMHSCHDDDNQKFIIPSSWQPGISSAQPQAGLQVSYPYNFRTVQEGVWENSFCNVDLLKDVIQTCDDTMSLLIGHATSVGTLRAIAKLVNDVGPERMPGTCCLDNPGNSQYFGYQYDPGQGMTCQIYGPWHLGITAQACESAGGRWFRTPCVTLKECVDDRPANGTEYFSQSFENFAVDLVIEDPSDESRCEEVREKLGFESDYPYDTEVCDKFHEIQCDSFFDQVDGVTAGLDISNTTRIKYTPVTYPDDDDLPFKELKDWPGYDEASGLGADTQQLGTLQVWTLSMEATMEAFDRAADFTEKLRETYCDAVPEVLCAAIACVNNPVKSICKFVSAGVTAVLYGIATVLAIAYQTLYTTLEIQTLSPGNELDEKTQVEHTYYNQETFYPWLYEALGYINWNIINQHIEMRKDLQDRHTQMVNDINQWVADVGCQVIRGLGAECTTDRRLEEGASLPPVQFEWPDEGGSLRDILRKIDFSNVNITKVVNWVRDKINGDDDDTDACKKKRTKATKAPTHRFSRNLLTEDDRGDLSHETKGIKGKVGGAMDVKMEEKFADMGRKVDAIVGKMDAMEDLIRQLIDQNKMQS